MSSSIASTGAIRGGCARRRFAAAFLTAAAILAAQATSAIALEVSRSREIAAPAAAVWAIVGEFCGIAQWHPQVERCVLSDQSEAEGETVAVRGLVAVGGLGTIVEVETRRDEKAMSYSYAFVQGPLPVKAYNAKIAVYSNGSRPCQNSGIGAFAVG